MRSSHAEKCDATCGRLSAAAVQLPRSFGNSTVLTGYYIFMATQNSQIRCQQCPSKTPFRPDPMNLDRAKLAYLSRPWTKGFEISFLRFLRMGLRRLNRVRVDEDTASLSRLFVSRAIRLKD